MARILLVEDECDLVRTLTDMLVAQGYEIEACRTGEEAIETLRQEKFDIILLDVMLPGEDGFRICSHIREQGIHAPVLMLTARGEVSNKVMGLNSGADDYLTKPFHPLELQARIQALLRRRDQQGDQLALTYEVEGVLFDFTNRQMVRDGIVTELSERECRILRYLIKRRGEVVSREDLLNEVWGYQAPTLTRTVDVHIVWLRQKIEVDPRDPRLIITVHGLGYRFSI